MSLALKLALSPLLVVQPLATRRRVPRLPEAAGPRDGVCGDSPHELRLLIVGDSSAAGVGVANQSEALAGQLVNGLATLARVRVRWQLVARSGVNSEAALELLRESQVTRCAVAVVVLGVNDVVDQVPSHRAIAAREQLADWLIANTGARHVVFAPLPPVHRFPALPQPLRWIAGMDARRHDLALARWAAERSQRRGDVSHVPIELPLGPDNMASDGFHPGAPVYRACGHALARHIATGLWPAIQPPKETRT